jgi:prephenate dehydrogenase
MRIDKETKILIIGLGVIGGSYAAALSERGYCVRAITKDEKDIEYAKMRGLINTGTAVVDPALIYESDLIIFALYPKTLIAWLSEYGHLIKRGTLLTDVSGVKTELLSKILPLIPEGCEFVSAHPMAGRERSGVEFSDSHVFLGANFIITPTAKNTDEGIESCRALAKILGFGKISVLSPEKHDEMIAFLSQLTHCIAVSLMNCNTTENLEKYTGDSFRDLTRIAKINENMWPELFIMNKGALLLEMDRFMREFSDFRDLIEKEDVEAIKSKMRSSTEKRSLFDRKEGK